MKPFRGVFSVRPYADELNGKESTPASPAPLAEVAPGLVSPRPGPKHLLWEVLVELGFIEERGVLEAEAVARAARQDLGVVLLERGLVSSEQLARAVAQREGVLFADLETYTVDEGAASLITPAVAERYGAIPIGYGPGGDVLLALANPRERHVLNDISMMVEPSVTSVVATQESIDALIRTRKEETYETELGERVTGVAENEVAMDAHALDGFALDGPALGGPSVAEPQPAGVNESPQWFDSEAPAQRAVQAEVPSSLVLDLEHQPGAFDESSPDREADAPDDPSPDRELLESLTRSVEQVDRLVRETARGRDADLEAAAADSERRLSKLQVELDRELAERADTEGSLREQLETERAARGESERKLREDAEVERTSREQLERGLREELESERAERGEPERVLREELENERSTREALAIELAAVRTARDDLARRVASARDLLELGARPIVPLNGRER